LSGRPGAATTTEPDAMRTMLQRAARERGRVRLVYGSVPYVVTVLSVDGDLVTGTSEERGPLRFRLGRVTEVSELPSSRPLF